MPVPRQVRAFSAMPVSAVSAGARHVLALLRAGQVYSWGENLEGQLGDGTFLMSSTPKEVERLRRKPVVGVAAGGSHSLVLTVSGRVYAFGNNAFGQLGVGDTKSRLWPTAIPSAQVIPNWLYYGVTTLSIMASLPLYCCVTTSVCAGTNSSTVTSVHSISLIPLP